MSRPPGPSPRAPRAISAIRLRGARRDDAGALAALHAESWRRTYRGVFDDAFLDGGVVDERRAAWEARLGPGGAATIGEGLVVVAERVGGARVRPPRGLLGFVCAVSRADDGFGVFVDNLHVAAGHEGLGLGTALLARVAAWASEAGIAGAPYLWVAETNLRARRFYEARGAADGGPSTRANPGGGTARYRRYVWASPRALATWCDAALRPR